MENVNLYDKNKGLFYPIIRKTQIIWLIINVNIVINAVMVELEYFVIEKSRLMLHLGVFLFFVD